MGPKSSRDSIPTPRDYRSNYQQQGTTNQGRKGVRHDIIWHTSGRLGQYGFWVFFYDLGVAWELTQHQHHCERRLILRLGMTTRSGLGWFYSSYIYTHHHFIDLDSSLLSFHQKQITPVLGCFFLYALPLLHDTTFRLQSQVAFWPYFRSLSFSSSYLSGYLEQGIFPSDLGAFGTKTGASYRLLRCGKGGRMDGPRGERGRRSRERELSVSQIKEGMRT